MEQRVRGVWCATLTPLDRQRNIDAHRFAEHVRALFAEGIDGVAPFGTTGEGQSFTVAERKAGLETLLRADVPPTRIVPGTGCSALGDAIDLTRHAIGAGCAGALVLPPFFFKDVGDEGVFASYARLIEAVGDDTLRLYLYHIPQVSGVRIGVGAIERLVAAFGGVIAGVKDSSGDLANSLELVRRFPALRIVVGHEPHLPALLAAGGAGTICGLANLYPRVLRRLHDATSDRDREPSLRHVRRLLDLLEAYPLIPAIKAACAELRNDAAWLTMREPLLALDDAAFRSLCDGLRALGEEG